MSKLYHYKCVNYWLCTRIIFFKSSFSLRQKLI